MCAMIFLLFVLNCLVLRVFEGTVCVYLFALLFYYLKVS